VEIRPSRYRSIVFTLLAHFRFLHPSLITRELQNKLTLLFCTFYSIFIHYYATYRITEY